MSYIETTENKIETTVFAELVPTIEGDGGFEVLKWSKPESKDEAALTYILCENVLSVVTDDGDVMLKFSEKQTFEQLRKLGIKQFLRSMVAHSKERWEFDAQSAYDALNEWTEEQKYQEMESVELVSERLYNEIKNWSSAEDWDRAVFAIYNQLNLDWFDTEEAVEVAEFGKQLPYYLIKIWKGLQLATQRIEN